MNLHSQSAFLLMILLASTGTLSAEEKITESPYYPLAVGNEWIYQITAGGVKRTVSVKITRHEKKYGTVCALAETSSNGKVFSTEHLWADKNGIYRNSARFGAAKPLIRIFKLPVKDGAKWTVDSKVQDQRVKGTYTVKIESLKLPAGEFKKAVFTRCPDMDLDVVKWNYTGAYAKGVGLIYQKIIRDNGVVIVQELKEFKPAKK